MAKNTQTGIDMSDRLIFEKVFKEYYRPMFLFAESFVMDPYIADDIVQDIFLKVLSNKLVVSTSIKNYLFRAVRNNSLDYLKKYNIEDIQEYHLFDSCFYSGNFEFSEDRRTEERVQKAIDTLPKKCAEILKMNLYQSYSYKEIAENLDISINTVKTQIRRAYKQLREELRDVKINLFGYFFIKKM